MYLLSSGHFISSIKVWLYFIMRWEKNVLEKDSLKTSPYAQLLSSTEFRILGLLICFCLNSSLPCSSPLGMDIYVLHEYQALNGLKLDVKHSAAEFNIKIRFFTWSQSPWHLGLKSSYIGKRICLKSIQTKWVGPPLMVHNTNAQWPIENQNVITLRVKLKLFSSTQLRFLRRFQMQDSQVKGEGRPFHLLLML